MKQEEIFRVEGRLRPFWRFLLSASMIFFVYICVGIILHFAFTAVGHRPGFFMTLFWVNLLMLPALLAIFKFLTFFAEDKPLGSVGLAFCGRWRAELAMGVALGAGMILVVGGVERLLGVVHFTWTSASSGRILGIGAFSIAVLFIAATNEELVFRGYPFQRLVDSVGPVGAVVVLSVIFGVVHLGNPNHTWLSTVNTMLVGVTLAVAYLRTRALWLPIGIHFSWNLFQGCVLGLPVSGLAFPATLLTPQVAGPRWLTGGSYGPEGSVLTFVVIGVITLYLLVSKSIYTSKEMKELVFGVAQDANVSSAVEEK